MKINIKKIKTEMARNGWNYTKLATEANESKQWLSFVLGEKYKWNNLRTIEKIARALNIEPRDLIQ